MKKKKGNNKKIIIIIVVILLALLAFVFYKSTHKEKKAVVEEVKKEDEIETKEFSYTLYDNKSDLYKEYFGNLKEELTKDVIEEENYAKIISQLFAVDFYSLKDKNTSTDVGGLDFIYPKMKDNFVLKAEDTIYKNVESNVYGDRKQTLPKVTEVTVKSATKKKVKINDVKDDNGYVVVVNIKYDKDLKLPKTVTLTIVHEETKLYIVEVK
jgi:hypothetical protein